MVNRGVQLDLKNNLARTNKSNSVDGSDVNNISSSDLFQFNQTASPVFSSQLITLSTASSHESGIAAAQIAPLSASTPNRHLTQADTNTLNSSDDLFCVLEIDKIVSNSTHEIDEIVANDKNKCNKSVPVSEDCSTYNSDMEVQFNLGFGSAKDMFISSSTGSRESNFASKSTPSYKDHHPNPDATPHKLEHIIKSQKPLRLLHSPAYKHSVQQSFGIQKLNRIVAPSRNVNRPKRLISTLPRKTSNFKRTNVLKSASLNFKRTDILNSGIPLLSPSQHTESDHDHDDQICPPAQPDTFFGLPIKVKQLLQEHRGISTLYKWQQECLQLSQSTPRNLIYCLPTSGGKTLVAEILIFYQLLCCKKNAILILPFVSIVQEKFRMLTPFALELGFYTEEYAGSKGAFPPKIHRLRQTLYIATIEKAHTLVNSMIENCKIDTLGLVVVDELHMIGEGGSRGSSLELTLSKLKYSSQSTRIVGMSATLSNVEHLTTFLNAELFSSNFRPVELTEYVKVEDNIFKVNEHEDNLLQPSRKVDFNYNSKMKLQDPDNLIGLVSEVLPKHSCLIFCPTKRNCQAVAELIVRNMPALMKEVKSAERYELVEKLVLDTGSICPTLSTTLPFGVAYHHSGLTADERKLIEEGFLSGTLCLLACTSTLAAGVNLPAKRVIIRSLYIGDQLLSRSQYKQMCGRAGRAGFDSTGESILIAQKNDVFKAKELVSGEMDSCYSSLMYDGGRGVTSLTLNVIALQLTSTMPALVEFMNHTLIALQSERNEVDLAEASCTSLDELISKGLVIRTTSEEICCFKPTDFGRAVFKGAIDVRWCVRLYDDLKAATKNLAVCNWLHLLFLVTPYDYVSQVNIDWTIYLHQFHLLSTDEVHVARLIGVSESYLTRKASGISKSKHTPNDLILKRFYLTLMLRHLIKEASVWHVANMFAVSRGFLQQMLSTTASFCSCVVHFCKEVEELWAFDPLLSCLQRAIQFCCKKDLIPLMEVPGVKLSRARQLLQAGYKSLQGLARANPEDIVKNVKHMSRKLANQIVSSAKLLIRDKAEELRNEANELLGGTTSPSNPIYDDLLQQWKDSNK